MEGSVRRLNIITTKTLILLCAALWFTCLVAPGRLEVFDLWRCGDYKHTKIVYRLHDQAEDEESKSLPIINTSKNMTILCCKEIINKLTRILTSLY